MTKAKAALYAGWVAGLGAVVLAGRFGVAGGALFVVAGVLIVLATKWGVVGQFNGSGGRPLLQEGGLRFVSIVTCVIAVAFVVLGLSLIAGG